MTQQPPLPSGNFNTLIFPYDIWYDQPTGKVYSAAEVKNRYNIDPVGADAAFLNTLRLYPVNRTEPLKSLRLYDLTSVNYTLNGTAYDQTYTLTAKSLADAKVAGEKIAILSASITSQLSYSTGGISPGMSAGLSSMLAADRPAIFTTFINNIQGYINTCKTNVQNITAATTVEQIHDIVFPPLEIKGGLTLTRTGNNASAATWTTALTGALASEVSIVYPSGEVAYNSGSSSYPATTGAWSGSPYTFTVKWGSFTIGTFTASTTSATEYTIDWYPLTYRLPVNYNDFYFKQIAGIVTFG